MSLEPAKLSHLIWATRGRSWGFRFLLDAGLIDPLPTYERAFAGLVDTPTVWHRAGQEVALRLPDPHGRRDSAGRLIPHEFVVLGDLAVTVGSVEDGMEQIWPLVESAYESVWDANTAPTSADLSFDA